MQKDVREYFKRLIVLLALRRPRVRNICVSSNFTRNSKDVDAAAKDPGIRAIPAWNFYGTLEPRSGSSENFSHACARASSECKRADGRFYRGKNTI